MKQIKLFDTFKDFWFKEQSPAPVALFRIFFGLFVLQMSLIEILPNFVYFFGVKGLIDSATLATYWWRSNPIFNIFLLLPQKDIYRWEFFFVFILFAIFLTIGFRTRLSAIIVFLGLLTLDRQNPFILDAGDDFMRLMSFLLIFGAAGEAYSLDRLFKAKKAGCRLSELPPAVVSPWAQRMIQVQISLAYLDAFLAKSVGPQWQSGTAVYYASQLADFARFPMPWLTSTYPGYLFLTYYTLFAELAMGTLVWIKPLRYWILLMAAFLHAGIDWTMNLPCFEWLFICSYVNFIEPQDLEKALSRCRSTLSRFLRVSIDHAKPSQTITQSLGQYYSVMPLLLTLILVLLLGSWAAIPLRKQLVAKEIRHNYETRLSKTRYLWTNKCAELAQTSDRAEEKINAEEALGVVLSLNKEYAQAGQLLRDVSQKRVEQNKPYNAELIRAFSALSNIYLETGHLDAGELCYRTILDYDKVHLSAAKSRLPIDFNNLGVIYYFRALINKDKLGQQWDFNQADTYFRQALNNSHFREPESVSGFQLNKADILSNQYLCLRDQGRFKEAKSVKDTATRLNSSLNKRSLP